MPFPSMNTWYWSRFRINGSSISLKRWLDGNPEPESYHLTVTDSDVPAAGWAGLVVSGAVSGVGDFYVDTFGVGTGGDPAPSAALNTAPTITVAPTVSYGSLTRLGPNNSPAVVSFTATDAEQTGADELSYTIRTATAGGGTLVGSGTCTSGASKNHNIANADAGLVDGSQTLYLRVFDGWSYSADLSFTLLLDTTAPTVGAITHSPNPVVP